jgi:putative sterol carrier protein
MADQISETLSDSLEIYHKLAQGELTAREAIALTRLKQIEREFFEEDDE